MARAASPARAGPAVSSNKPADQRISCRRLNSPGGRGELVVAIGELHSPGKVGSVCPERRALPFSLRVKVLGIKIVGPLGKSTEPPKSDRGNRGRPAAPTLPPALP